MSRLRVLVGPSPSELVPITQLVNTNTPHPISSDLFDGHVIIHIKGFTDTSGNVRHSDYFERQDKKDISWSIQVQGRFLHTYSSDDILFGNTFDRPLHLPPGSSAVLKFMKYIDPDLEHDLFSQKPWALSPLISTMPHFKHERLLSPQSSTNHLTAAPAFPSLSIQDDTSHLHLALTPADPPPNTPLSSSSSSSLAQAQDPDHPAPAPTPPEPAPFHALAHGSKKQRPRHADPFNFRCAQQRRSYFSQAQHRRDIEFGPHDLITTDFCYGFLDFNPRLALRLPGGISFDLMKYWDGQPFRFSCCERNGEHVGAQPWGAQPWGATFWCVSIERADDDDDDDDETEGKRGCDVD